MHLFSVLLFRFVHPCSFLVDPRWILRESFIHFTEKQIVTATESKGTLDNEPLGQRIKLLGTTGFGDTQIESARISKQMGIQGMEFRIVCIELQATLYFAFSACPVPVVEHQFRCQRAVRV